MSRPPRPAIPFQRRWRISSCCALTCLVFNALNAQNLVTNPGFENGTTGWYGSGLTISGVNTHSGSACGTVTVAAYGTACGQDVSGKLQVGQTYTWSAWLRASVASTIFMNVALAGPGGSSSASIPKSISTTWTLYSTTFSASFSGALTSSIVSIQAERFALTVFLDDVSITNSSPVLGLARTNQSVLLSWPTTATNYTLQTTTNLAAPITWAAVTNTVQSNAAAFSLTLPGTNPSRFFRLQKP